MHLYLFAETNILITNQSTGHGMKETNAFNVLTQCTDALLRILSNMNQ